MGDSRVGPAQQRVSKPFLIGVAGGTASGKSTVCEKIMAKLGHDCQRRVALIKQDSFYKKLTEEQLALAKRGDFNFDHPSLVDEKAMIETLQAILDGKPVKLPIHDYVTNCSKTDEFYEVNSADVVLFAGVLIFYFPQVRDMFNMKLFVDTDSDTRLSRRVMRDVRERGRNLEAVLNQYDQFVKPAFEEFCLPTKKYADMIIPRGAENEVAIGLINHNVTYLLSSELYLIRNGPLSPLPMSVGSNSSLHLLSYHSGRSQQTADGISNNLTGSQSLSPQRSRSNSYSSSGSYLPHANPNIQSAIIHRSLSPDIAEE